MNKHEAVAAILTQATTDIELILSAPEDELHLLRIKENLTRLGNYFVLVHGVGQPVGSTVEQTGAATTVLGEKIQPLHVTKPEAMKPNEEEKAAFKAQVENAFEAFSADRFTDADLLITFPERVIRGVAKKAGMQVTMTEPAEIDSDFVAQVRKEIEAADEAKKVDEKTAQPTVTSPAPAETPVNTVPPADKALDENADKNGKVVQNEKTAQGNSVEKPAPEKRTIDASAPPAVPPAPPRNRR